MMDDASYQVRVMLAATEMAHKRRVIHDRYQLDRASRWTYDAKQTQPNFAILDAGDRPLLRATTLEVGTFHPGHGTWKWGWSNPSVLLDDQRRLLALRELATITGRDLFHDDQPFLVSREDALGLLALAVQHLDAQGGYAAEIVNNAGESLTAHIAYMAVEPGDEEV